jgi:outer membrane protein assembly factor BamD
MAARDGEPSLTDPKPTLAPDVTRAFGDNVKTAMNPNTAPGTTAATTTTPATPEAAPAEAAATPTQPAAPKTPLSFQEIPNESQAESGSGTSSMTNVPGSASSPSGPAPANAMGVQILTNTNAARADDNGGLKAVGPDNAVAAPAIEKAAPAPDAVNDVAPGSQPAAQAAPADGKKAAKPGYDKDDESSSKHKKKKGLSKLNPF